MTPGTRKGERLNRLLLYLRLVFAALGAAVAVLVVLGVDFGLLGVVLLILLAGVFAVLGVWFGRVIVRRQDREKPDRR